MNIWTIRGSSRRGWFGIAALVLLGTLANCAAAFGQTDDFPEKLKRGCETEEQCNRLVVEAQARRAKCQPNTIGYIRCGDADADLQIASGYLNEKTVQRAKTEKEKDEDERRAERKRMDDERQAQQLARQKAAEALESEKFRREEERAEQAEALWRSIEPKKCSERGDLETCAQLEEYARSFSDAPHAPEARVALRVGREVQARQAEQREAVNSAAASNSSKPASKPAATRKKAKCCNGSIDASCGCEGGDGCCFQRGGVCSCE